MIPQIPLLKRENLRAGISGAQYSPYTLLLHLPNLPEDLATLSINSSAEIDAAITHEKVHWVQYHGTTVGNFLSLLRYSQEKTTVSWLLELPNKARENLINRRRPKAGKSVVEISKEGELQPSGLVFGEDFELLRQIWYDHQLVHSMIEFSPNQDGVSFPRDTVFGEVVSDTLLHLNETLGLPSQRAVELRKMFTFSDDPLFVSIKGERMTTRGIMESMATSNELLNLILSKVLYGDKMGLSDNIIEAGARRLLNGHYGIAVKGFLYNTGIDIKHLLEMLPTFAVVCDLALNPPLPPLVRQAPKNSESWEWKDIYPPIRFIRIAKIIPKIGILPLELSHNLIFNYVSNICTILNWPNPFYYTHPYDSSETIVDFSTFEPEDNLNTPSNINYHHYLLWVQSKMWQERGASSELFTNLAMCKFGALAKKHVDLIFSNERWFDPPLCWTTRNLLGYRTASTKFGNWFLYSSFIHNMLYDFMVGRGKFDLSAYPPDFRENQATLDFLEHGLQQTFDVEIKIN